MLRFASSTAVMIACHSATAVVPVFPYFNNFVKLGHLEATMANLAPFYWWFPASVSSSSLRLELAIPFLSENQSAVIDVAVPVLHFYSRGSSTIKRIKYRELDEFCDLTYEWLSGVPNLLVKSLSAIAPIPHDVVQPFRLIHHILIL
jgi:hypothetical protein